MLATDPWSELVIHQCPRPNINNALLVWERLANSVAIPDMPSSISWCTWLTATAFSRDWDMLSRNHVFSLRRPPVDDRSASQDDTGVTRQTSKNLRRHLTLLRSTPVAYTHCNEYLGPRNCIYKVKSLVVLNMSHIYWRGHSLLRPPNRIIGGGDMSPPSPPVSVPMNIHFITTYEMTVNTLHQTLYLSFSNMMCTLVVYRNKGYKHREEQSNALLSWSCEYIYLCIIASHKQCSSRKMTSHSCNNDTAVSGVLCKA